MNLDELVRQFRADPALLALDFDGTLAPIVVDPESSRPLPGIVDALTALAAKGTRIAIITGRDARTVIRLGGLEAVPGLIVAGLYGAETWIGGELTRPPAPAQIDQLRSRLPEAIEGGDPALWIEDKGLSLVVHARRAANPAEALSGVRDAVQELATELGLETHPGRDVLEIRLPGFDKGTALRALVDQFKPETVIFGGDDRGDLPAFAAVRELRDAGLAAFAVGADSVDVPELAESVDLVVDGPNGVLALLRALAR